MSQMRTPGRPASPTLHPRTRAEGMEYATRNRQTSDWFRHDGKNVEEAPPPPARLQGHLAPEVAEKNKGAPEEWYEHNPNNPSEPAPKGRIHTEEAQKVQEKVAGKEEPWYKHEENKEYHTPRPKSRLTSQEGEEVMNKLGRADTMDWFKHEHGSDDVHSTPPPKARTGAVPYGEDNKAKLHPTAAPNWYEHDAKAAAEEQKNDDFHGTPLTRLKTAEANEFKQRSQQGSAADWYGHDGSVGASPQESARGSARTKEIHTKLKSESGNWFSHDPKQDYTDVQPGSRGGSEFAHDMADRARGNEMNAIMHGSGNQQGSPAGRAVKPEGKDNASRNKEGMMSKYLDYEANKDHESARAQGRAVKPEGMENLQKNQGCMSEIMGGYPAGGPSSHDGKRVKPEAEQNARKNKGTMGSIISHDNQADAAPVTRMNSEAANNKARNKGSMSGILGGTNEMSLNDRPQQRVMSESARMAAERNRGTMGSILGGGN